MKITVNREKLIGGLQAVQNVVGSRTTLPILSNVLIQGFEDRLALTATDLDVTISSSVQATIERGGAVTLPVKRLFGIVRELATPEVELDVNEKNICSLQSGAAFAKIHGLPAEEFPQTPGFDDVQEVVLPQEKLNAMLRKTAYAVSTEEARYVLNGILFALKEHQMTLVATDGRRLAMVDEEIEVRPETLGEFIVPSKAIGELTRLLGDKGNVSIQYTENQVSFTLARDGEPSTWVVTKLVEGSYPNYRQVIPSSSAERITLDREELLHALRRAEIMTSDKANSVRFHLSKNTLVITANTPEVGEARESIAINYKGKEFEIAFNPAYMMDPLKVLEDDEVNLELTDELSPGVLKVQEPFLYVIMPMRVTTT